MYVIPPYIIPLKQKGLPYAIPDKKTYLEIVKKQKGIQPEANITYL